nr:PASTA domain-containing protein [Streptococcus oralis]
MWAKAETEDERGRIQILLAEAEADLNEYLLEKEREAERKRLATERFQLEQQEEREQNELLERRRKKIRRIKWFFGIAISLLFLLIIGTFFIGMTKSKSSHNSTKQSTQSSNSEISTSSTTKSSLGGNKSQDKQTSSTTSASSSSQVSKVYIGNYIGRKPTDVVAELKEKKVPENLIKIEEEESTETEPGTILRQSLSEGASYDLSKSTQIVLTVAKKAVTVPMPSYIGSSLEFTKNNLVQIVGVKEANIEIVEVGSAPEGTAEGTVVDQRPKAGEKVHLENTRIKISIYKPKNTQTSQSRSR